MPWEELSKDILLDNKIPATGYYEEIPLDTKLDTGPSWASKLWTGIKEEKISHKVKEIKRGIGESVLSLASQFVSGPIAGLAGLYKLPFGEEEAKKAIEKVSEKLTYQPKTKLGQEITQKISIPFGILAKGGKKVGEWVYDRTGDPYLASLYEATTQIAPFSLIPKTLRKPTTTGKTVDIVTPKTYIPSKQLISGRPQLAEGVVPIPGRPAIAGKPSGLFPPSAERPMLEGQPPPAGYLAKPEEFTIAQRRTEFPRLPSAERPEITGIPEPKGLLAQPPDFIMGGGKPSTIKNVYERPTPATSAGFKPPGAVFLRSKGETLEVKYDPVSKNYKAVQSPQIEEMGIEPSPVDRTKVEIIPGTTYSKAAENLISDNPKLRQEAISKVREAIKTGKVTEADAMHNLNNEMINQATNKVDKGASLEVELQKASDSGKELFGEIGISKSSIVEPRKMTIEEFKKKFPGMTGMGHNEEYVRNIYKEYINKQKTPVEPGKATELTAEDIELKPKQTEGWKIANQDRQTGEIYSYKLGEKGVYNHADIMMKHEIKPENNITGFVDKNGDFIRQTGQEPFIAEPVKKGILGSEAGFIELPSKEEIGRAIKRVQEFWSPLSTLKQRDNLLNLRGEAKGDIARVERASQNMYKKLDKLSEKSKKDIFQGINGFKDMYELSPADQHTARYLANLNDVIGEMLVKRNIITPEQFYAHKGQYTSFMYLKHILGDDVQIPVKPNGKLNLSEAKHRKDLTYDQRKSLGLIEDISVSEPIGMAKALTDVAKYDYLEQVALDPRNIWEPSVVEVPEMPIEYTKKGAKGQATKLSLLNGDKFIPVEISTNRWIVWNADTSVAVGKKYGIGELVKEVDVYRKMAKEAPNSTEIQWRYKTLSEALKKAEEETKNVPADFIKIPEGKTWGPLSGTFIRKEIARDLMSFWGKEQGNIPGLGETITKIANLDEKLTAAFKVGKVPLNIPTVARNVVSNFIQMWMSGMPIYKIPVYYTKAIEGFINKTPEYTQAYRKGLFKTNWSITELNEVLQNFRSMKGDTFGSIIGVAQNLAKYYGKLDDITKMAKYLEQREKGVPVDKAAIEGQKWGMDYSLADPSVKWARKHFIPFASYSYKIIPLLAESIIKRPWVIGSLVALPTAIWQIAKQTHPDMTEEDWMELKRTIPLEVKERGTWMLVPWKVGDKWRWFDYSFFVPYGNILNAGKSAIKGDIRGVIGNIGMFNTPMWQIVKSIGMEPFSGKAPEDPFTGNKIYNEIDPPIEKAGKVVEFIANLFIPSMLSRFGVLGQAFNIGKEDRWGRKTDIESVVSRLFGVNLQEANEKVSKAALQAKINSLHDELTKIMVDPRIPIERKEKFKQRFLEQIQEEMQKYK